MAALADDGYRPTYSLDNRWRAALMEACRAAIVQPGGNYPAWDRVTVWGYRA